MKYFTVAFFVTWSLSAFAGKPQSVEIRFCPASAVRTYPLESRREEFALDIAKLGGDGLTHRGDGTKFEDYYAYGAEVLTASDGRVIKAANDQPEDPSAMQRPGETQEAYFARLQKEQGERLAKGLTAITGNYVMIDHGKNEYSLYAHLQAGSVRVHVGDQVKAGEVIGKLGSSGNSTEP